MKRNLLLFVLRFSLTQADDGHDESYPAAQPAYNRIGDSYYSVRPIRDYSQKLGVFAAGLSLRF